VINDEAIVVMVVSVPFFVKKIKQILIKCISITAPNTRTINIRLPAPFVCNPVDLLTSFTKANTA